MAENRNRSDRVHRHVGSFVRLARQKRREGGATHHSALCTLDLIDRGGRSVARSEPQEPKEDGIYGTFPKTMLPKARRMCVYEQPLRAKEEP